MAKRRLQGWHREDIKAAIRKRGITLTELALAYGLEQSAVRVALSRPYYPGEQVIADALAVPAQTLWPDRYDPDGTPRHPRARLRSQGSPEHHNRESQKARAA